MNEIIFNLTLSTKTKHKNTFHIYFVAQNVKLRKPNFPAPSMIERMLE